MCDERERLIGYVYDECDGDDRTQIDRHLESCATCREEIAGLQETRQDLLAWEVPDHGSVWRPFVPARLMPWWREVPAWAMATAAGVMFAIGIGGGATAQAVMASRSAGVTTPTPAPVSVAQSVDQTTRETATARAELAALEARMVSLNAVLNRHLSTGDGVTAVRVADTDSRLTEQVWNVSGDINEMWRKLGNLEAQQRQVNFQVAQLALLAGAGVPGR